MSYLGYKKISQRKYLREQKRVTEWKTKQREKRRRIREWCYISTTVILQLVIVALLIVFYGLFAIGIQAAETQKFGEGPFVMAISYTDYKNLQYVGNFPTCVEAEAYYHANCTDAPIMMCQAEARMYMPITHNPENTFSTFDFEINETQSCGFVGVDTFESSFTGVEE